MVKTLESMINLVLFHSGKQLPIFLEYTFKQIRVFNPDVMVYFLTDSRFLDDPLFDKYKIAAVDKDLFYSDKVKELELLYERPPDDFWMLTTTRLVYIENFLKAHKLIDVYHFENDVLLYYNLQEHHEKFKAFYERLAITPGGPGTNMTGFLFIKNWNDIHTMVLFFIELIKIHGAKRLEKVYKMDVINEMVLMKLFEQAKGAAYMSYLPIIPFGEFSNNFTEFNSIFDPASWGQFVGGTQTVGPGAKPNMHYIGQLLINNPDYTVVWKKDEVGRKIPYFKYDNNEVKINNLHIHSKNLSKYMS